MEEEYYYEEERTYENYNGSYAQDVEGWSDQDIDDVFDGDSDAYWNTDQVKYVKFPKPIISLKKNTNFVNYMRSLAMSRG